MFSVFFLLSYALKSEQRTFICTLNVLNLNTECDEHTHTQHKANQNKWVKKSFCEKSCNRDFDCKAQIPHRFNRTLKIKVNRLQGAPRARCTETWNRVVYNIHIQCVVYWMCMRVCAAHFDLKWFNTSHTASYTQTYTHTHIHNGLKHVVILKASNMAHSHCKAFIAHPRSVFQTKWIFYRTHTHTHSLSSLLMFVVLLAFIEFSVFTHILRWWNVPYATKFRNWDCGMDLTQFLPQMFIICSLIST